eukprot:3940590-Rhodomonas_salina.1
MRPGRAREDTWLGAASVSGPEQASRTRSSRTGMRCRARCHCDWSRLAAASPSEQRADRPLRTRHCPCPSLRRGRARCSAPAGSGTLADVLPPETACCASAGASLSLALPPHCPLAAVCQEKRRCPDAVAQVESRRCAGKCLARCPREGASAGVALLSSSVASIAGRA